MATQAERTERTRRALIACATTLFGERGFDATTTNEILSCAGVSKGAMYHHFASKRDLMEAVYADVASRAIGVSIRRSSGESPRETLVSACLAWLEAVRAPDVARILLDEGPGALGWDRCRAIEDRASLRLMETSVRNVLGDAASDSATVRLNARLLNALLAETALTLVNREVPGLTLESARATVVAFIDALVPAGSAG